VIAELTNPLDRSIESLLFVLHQLRWYLQFIHHRVSGMPSVT
jgi:hypothetical protein